MTFIFFCNSYSAWIFLPQFRHCVRRYKIHFEKMINKAQNLILILTTFFFTKNQGFYYLYFLKGQIIYFIFVCVIYKYKILKWWITFLKSISCVTKVPSEHWNSKVITSSVTLEEIVSNRISPPCKLKIHEWYTILLNFKLFEVIRDELLIVELYWSNFH